MSNITSWLTETMDDKAPSWTHERKPRRNLQIAQLRETNKRLRTIYNEAGLNYGEDIDETHLVKRIKVAENLRKANVNEVLKNIHQAKNVEICFLVDATRSMQKHIDGVKDSINQIVDLLKQPNDANSRQKKATVKTLRLSMVAYRDFCDANRFEICPFTESVEIFKEFCGRINADGGGDVPEDVFGGIDKALNLDWTDECGTKLIFHIADAPCHGKKYHDLQMHLTDSYPNGDPKGLTEDVLFRELADKNMDYYFGKITEKTDQMIIIFSKVYGREITQFDIEDVKAITSSVFTAVSTSVFFSTKATRDGPRKNRTYTLIPDIPAWSCIPQLTGRFLNYEMPVAIEDVINDVPLFRNPPKRAVVQIAPNPFAHGAERYAFYGRDLTITSSPANIVLKEYINIESGNNAARYEITNQIQTVASFFAAKFNEVFKQKLGYYYYIKFLKVQTLCIPGNEKEDRYFSCEKQYNKDDKFVRFTNNADYSILEETAEKMDIDFDFVSILTAFSHWTYQATKGKIMVVDLQGIVTKTDDGDTAILTDPAIHCVDKTRFGRMNLGKEGMEYFFKRHDCNKYCKALNLIPVLVDGENECF